MWAQMLTRPYQFEPVTVDAPSRADLREGDVLLATRAGAICGSDLPSFRGAKSFLPADQGAEAARIPGYPMHEIVGEVIASRHHAHDIGSSVVGWASGFDGIAEVIVTRGDGLVPYDRTIAATTAVLIQPLACVIYAVEQVRKVAGAKVAVIGQGPIGLLFTHVLKAQGARHVTGVDRIDRSDFALRFRVDETVTAPADRWAAMLSEEGRPSLVVEAVGHQVSTMRACIDGVAFGGEIFYFGIPDDPVYPFEMMAFLRKNLRLGSGFTVERRRMLYEATAYLDAHPDLLDGYVTDVFRADDVQAAFAAAASPKPGRLKIAIDMA